MMNDPTNNQRDSPPLQQAPDPPRRPEQLEGEAMMIANADMEDRMEEWGIRRNGHGTSRLEEEEEGGDDENDDEEEDYHIGMMAAMEGEEAEEESEEERIDESGERQDCERDQPEGMEISNSNEDEDEDVDDFHRGMMEAMMDDDDDGGEDEGGTAGSSMVETQQHPTSRHRPNTTKKQRLQQPGGDDCREDIDTGERDDPGSIPAFRSYLKRFVGLVQQGVDDDDNHDGTGSNSRNKRRRTTDNIIATTAISTTTAMLLEAQGRLAQAHERAGAAFYENIPTLPERQQVIVEYGLPITLPMMIKGMFLSNFAAKWGLGIAILHTFETLVSSFGSATKDLRLKEWITTPIHYLIDCFWLNSLTTTMFYHHEWFHPNENFVFWMAIGFILVLPNYLAYSFKTTYLAMYSSPNNSNNNNSSSSSNNSMSSKSQSHKEETKALRHTIEVNFIEIFYVYGCVVGLLILTSTVSPNAFKWGVIITDLTPFWVTWSHQKRIEPLATALAAAAGEQLSTNNPNKSSAGSRSSTAIATKTQQQQKLKGN